MENILIIIISFFAAYGIICTIIELTKLLRKKYNYKIQITMYNQTDQILDEIDKNDFKDIIYDRCINEKIFGSNPDIDIEIINNYNVYSDNKNT